MTTTEAFAALMPEPAYWHDATQSHVISDEWRKSDEASSDYRAAYSEALYTAEQMRAMFDAATERAAKQEREECALVAQNMLDLEGDVGADDWTAEMGWDWACQKIRDAIRARDEGVSNV